MSCKVYVGGLPADARNEELEDVFSRYGRLRKVWVARRPPGFAFLEYDDTRDAEDAVRGMDGRTVCGSRVRVEMSHADGSRGGPRRGGGQMGAAPYGGGRPMGGGGGGGAYDRRRSPSPRRSPRRSPSPRRSRSRSPRRYSRDSKDRSPRRYSRSPRRYSRSPVERRRSRSGSPVRNEEQQNGGGQRRSGSR